MMYDNRQSIRKYAVVKFKLDSTYVEIPAIWLTENSNGQWCFWPPRTANTATLISDYVTPDYDTWGQYEVEIIKFCSSLESAQQSAANYQMTDKKQLEKQKRQHVSSNHNSKEDKRCNVISPTSTQKIEDLDIKQNIQKILHIQAAANILLKDVNQRLTKIETTLKYRINNIENNDDLMAIFLPFATIENIIEFDVLLETTDEAVTQFKKFIAKTGGINPKSSIHRILEKIFTNECAMNCSWKGMRQNFRIMDLYITKLLRKEIVSRYVSLTESEFDNVVAEWIRLAKQRKQRSESKATRNEESDCTN